MSLSDCSECWETPCVCGYGYKDYTNDKLIKLIVSMLIYKSKGDKIVIIEEVNNKIKYTKDG